MIDVGGTAAESIVGDSGIGMPIVGLAAEDAAVSGNPVLVGGRFDSVARTLDTGDTGAIALAADGAVHIDDGGNSITIDGTVTANAGTGTFTVDNGGTFAVQEDGAALTALQLIDDIVATLGTTTYTETTTKGAVVGAVRNDTLAALANTDNEIAPLQVNASGALYIQEGAALDVSAATVTVDNAGTFAVQEDGAALTALQLIDDVVGSTGAAVPSKANAIGFTDLTNLQIPYVQQLIATDNNSWAGPYFPIVHTLPLYFDGSGWDRMRGDATDGMLVNLGANNDVAPQGPHQQGTGVDITNTHPILIGGQLDDVGTITITEGQAGFCRITSRRALYTTFETPAGDSPWDDSNDALQVNIVAGTVTANAGSGTFTVTDDGSFTLAANSGVDIGDVTLNNGFASVTGGGAEASALRVTIANDSTGVVSIDDNAGSLTIDNTNIDNLHSSDFDTGGGTDTTPSIGIAVPASGGAAVVPGDATAGLKVDLGADNDVTVAGTVTVTDDGAFTLAANSGVDIGDVDVTSVAAGTNRIGGTYEVGGEQIDESPAVLTVKRAAIGAASSGENTLVSAVAAKQIRVLSLMIVAGGDVELYFNNATDGAIFGDSTNKIDLTTNSGFVLPHNPHGWFQTGTVNEALRVNLDGAVKVSGGLTYVEV